MDHSYRVPECSCGSGRRWCKVLAGDDNWLPDNFGCSFSAHVEEHFKLDPTDGAPYFKRVFRYPYQTKPLILRSAVT